MSEIELMVPSTQDLILKYTWNIKKYSQSVGKKDFHDSPHFEFNVNGLQTKWNLSIRYWKGSDGKRIMSPVVLCLNLVSCKCTEPEQAKVRFQFGIFNSEVKQWEMCLINRVVLQLQDTHEMMSLGYRDLSILDRHQDKQTGDVQVFVKIQLVPSETDRHSLAQDMARLMLQEDGDVTVLAAGNKEFHAHYTLLVSRSKIFAEMLRENHKKLDLTEVPEDVVREILRYIYTDRVENLDNLASTLIAAADRFKMSGLQTLCERSLMETITPESVASLLLLADRFNCDALKKAALVYCEDNQGSITTTLAWKAMEIINPELYVEVCEEVGLGSSISSNLDSLPSDTELNGKAS